jgi:phosphoribulokinase
MRHRARVTIATPPQPSVSPRGSFVVGPLPAPISLYEGLHGRITSVNIARYADQGRGGARHQPGVDQRSIATRSRGYSMEAVTDTMLRRMPDT